MGEKSGELAAGFASGNRHERDEFAVKPGFAHEQARRNGDADPAVLQNVHCESGAAGCQIAIDADIVVDARERRFDGRRLGIAIRGKGTSVKSAVIFDGQNDPARRVRGDLRVGSGRKQEQKDQNGDTSELQDGPFVLEVS